MVTLLSKNTSWTAWISSTPSAIGLWNALRPTISPVPPARLLITAVRTAWARSCAPFDSPPELMSPIAPGVAVHDLPARQVDRVVRGELVVDEGIGLAEVQARCTRRCSPVCFCFIRSASIVTPMWFACPVRSADRW